MDSPLFCEHCGTRFTGRYGKNAAYSGIEYPMEKASGCAHTEKRCRETLTTTIRRLEEELDAARAKER